MFQTDINSALKPHPQNKDGGQGTGPNGRKASMSHGTGNLYSITSPTSTRPGARRRESIDPSPFSAGLTSPTATRHTRDDPSYWGFGRKGTESKDVEGDDDAPPLGQIKDSSQPKTPFGLARSNTAGSTSGLGSLWSGASATTPGGSSIGGSAMGSFGNFALPTHTSSAKQLAGGRGESKFAKLIPQESNENLGGGKPGADPGHGDFSRSWRSRPRTDTDPFGDDGAGGSSFGASGLQQGSPPPLPQQPGQATLETPVKGGGGLGDLGMTGLHISHEDIPLSPSATNPYGSPPTGHHEDDGVHDDHDFEKSRMGDQNIPPFNAASRGYGAAAFDGSDRSQTSSAGARPYAALNAFGGGWPSGGGSVGAGSAGTPDRERIGFASAFGGPIFSPVTEGQPSGLGGFGGVFGNQPPVGGTASIGRGSKLGSLFPPQMQAQMQGQDHDTLGDSVPDVQQSNNPLGAIGRGSIGHGRDTGTPLRTGQGVIEEALGSSARSMGFGANDSQPTPIGTMAQGQSFTATAPGVPYAGPGAGAQESSDSLSAQIRTMVMPDRMRWVYLDPQGKVQGPFTGLEMNDWYKAQFFTPDLRVKKLEDKEFEPLGQLIRRIGNSREPFLVPQIGIAHGAPTQAGPFSPSGPTGVLPPLSSVFPIHGRTLTAEEQNNLERRKQEEQLMMAHNRESYMRQIQHQNAYGRIPGTGGGALHHHSSAHSLQSQPSFGSISSPIGMPPQAAGPIGTAPTTAPPGSGYFDASMAAHMPSAAAQAPAPGAVAPANMAPTADVFREDELANLTFAERQMLTALHGPGGTPGQPGASVAIALSASTIQHVDARQPESQSLRSQLPTTDELETDPEGFRERLREFDEIRAQRERERDAEDTSASVTSGGFTEEHEGAPIFQRSRQVSKESAHADDRDSRPVSSAGPSKKTAAVAAKPSSGLPMPFPPPEQIEEEPLERIDSPPVQPPPMAPWAKEPESHHKGPSLREIQEAESRKAAQANQAAMAARRAALEQEAAELREKEKAATVAPGLPASSTWGQLSPINTTSPWAKPSTTKGGQVSATSQVEKKGRKTLAEIQREEEARKQKAKDQTVTLSGAASGAGKRYADLASKPNQPPLAHANTAVATGGGWATVGAGGKVKIPTGPAAQVRSVSTGNVKVATGRPAVPVTKPAGGPSVAKTEGNTAIDEFKKWLHRELSRGFNVTNSEFFGSLCALSLA